MSNLLVEAKMPSMDKLFQMATGIAINKNNTNNNDKPYSYSSIANAASKLIAIFPVLVSKNVPSDTAHMVSKYIEQVSCQFIMLALQAANIDTAKSGIEYLRKFHQNLDIDGNGINAAIAAMDQWIKAYSEASKIEENSISASMINEFGEQNLMLDDILESDRDMGINSRDIREILEAMNKMDSIQFYDTKLNPISINDYIVNEFSSGDYHVSIKPYVLNENIRTCAYDDNPRNLRKKYWNEYLRQVEIDVSNNGAKTLAGYNNDAKERIYRELLARQNAEEAEEEYRRRRTDYRTGRRDRREDRTRQEKDRRDDENARRMSGRNISVLRDQDIKKMNDALPSILVVKFYNKDENGVSGVATEFIVGVKSKIIPVTSSEVLRRIMNDNKDGKKFTNFMRAITGELKASELIFGLARIKDDVKSCKVKGAYGDTWNLLSNRAKAAHEQLKHGKHNDFSAITTLCISKYDADELFREENFDIEDPKNAFHFMQSYNLMAFAIADDATESLKVLFDNGTKQFDEISYRMLERETQDGTYKKLINLMAASK